MGIAAERLAGHAIEITTPFANDGFGQHGTEIGEPSLDKAGPAVPARKDVEPDSSWRLSDFLIGNDQVSLEAKKSRPESAPSLRCTGLFDERRMTSIGGDRHLGDDRKFAVGGMSCMETGDSSFPNDRPAHSRTLEHVGSNLASTADDETVQYRAAQADSWSLVRLRDFRHDRSTSGGGDADVSDRLIRRSR
jgi:hypothetical protein